MAGGKLSPRQKMINMMYLVLTALLALNISKEIVLAFVLINDGIEQTTKNFEKKNAVTYAAFAKAKMLDPAKTQKYYDKAEAVRKMSTDMWTHIEKLKKEIMVKAEQVEGKAADTIRLNTMEKKDENNIPSEILIGSTEDGSKGKARELKNKLNEYKKNLKAQLTDVKDGDKVEIAINTSDPPPSLEHGKQSWEIHNFDHIPLAPAIVLLTKLQADVRNAEGDVINHLFSQISADDFKFDTLAAKVIAESNYVLLGSEYKADVFVAAFSTTQNPKVWLGNTDTVTNKFIGAIDSTSVLVEKGVGKYIIKPASEGEQKWGGVIRVLTPAGQIKEYPFRSSFIAAKPSMVVSADKMNVLYIGVDNPVSVSVPGVPGEKVKPSISQGSMSAKGKGSYIVRVNRMGEALVNVQAEVAGKMQSMGPAVKFRVKQVPNPIAKVANKPGGNISKAELLAQSAVIPVMENFDFELYFKVTSFEVTIAGKGRDIVNEKANGNAITANMRALMGKCRGGDKVYFENIKAVGPDGTTRTLSSISFTIM